MGYFPSPLELTQLSNVGIPLVSAILLLYLSLFTLTAAETPCNRYLRLILLPPIIYCFWDASSSYHLFPNSFIATGVATVACYGSLLALQYTHLQFWHCEKPRWIIIARKGKDQENSVSVYHSPGSENIPERLFYTFDLLCSVRGTSWLSDREWDWNPPRHRLGRATSSRSIPRRDFLRNNFRNLIKLYLLLDLIDTIIKTRTWDSQIPDPLYSIPIAQQCIYTVLLCIGTSVSMNFDYNIISSVAVWFGADPGSWPPLFYSPFQATSIADFWSNRWHWIFRRTFALFSMPAVRFVQRLSGKEKGFAVIITRIFSAFGISTALHFYIMYHAKHWAALKLGDGNIDRVTFWDADIFSFFMAQPFGIIFEKCVLELVLDRLFPLKTGNHVNGKCLRKDNNDGSMNNGKSNDIGKVGDQTPVRWEKTLIMRVFTWGFFTWTGRWWTNQWVHGGLFDGGTSTVPLSLIRSFWYRRIVS